MEAILSVWASFLALNFMMLSEIIMTTLTDKQIYSIGFFDKGGRYYLKEEFETSSSRLVRTPSRHWPYSVFKHVHTQKYFESLNDDQKRKIGI